MSKIGLFLVFCRKIYAIWRQVCQTLAHWKWIRIDKICPMEIWRKFYENLVDFIFDVYGIGPPNDWHRYEAHSWLTGYVTQHECVSHHIHMNQVGKNNGHNHVLIISSSSASSFNYTQKRSRTSQRILVCQPRSRIPKDIWNHDRRCDWHLQILYRLSIEFIRKKLNWDK